MSNYRGSSVLRSHLHLHLHRRMIHQKVDSHLALLKADEVNLEGGTKGAVTHLANQKLALWRRFRVTNL